MPVGFPAEQRSLSRRNGGRIRPESARNRVSLKDIEGLPFYPPERHQKPEEAHKILDQVTNIMRKLASEHPLEMDFKYNLMKPILDELVYDYFCLTETERAIVKETVSSLLPSVRPRSYKSIYTLIQHRAHRRHVETYARRLQAELESWRTRLKGAGNFSVEVVIMSPETIGPLGTIRVRLTDEELNDKPKVEQNDHAVEALLAELKQEKLLPMAIGENFGFAADALIWTESHLYMVRPLVQRFWLERYALRDARRIVSNVQEAMRLSAGVVS